MLPSWLEGHMVLLQPGLGAGLLLPQLMVHKERRAPLLTEAVVATTSSLQPVDASLWVAICPVVMSSRLLSGRHQHVN